MNARIQKLLEYLKESPNESFLLFALAKEYEGMEMIVEARSYYQQLMDKDPDYVGLYYHFGKLSESQEKLDEAMLIYTKGMDVAKKIGDRHALAEIKEAAMGLGWDEE
jgi:tetratricopeptide (TPR) repeat protein